MVPMAGTAVGNASQPSPNGEIFRGVAPAQLMFLRVFQIRKGWTSPKLHLYQGCGRRCEAWG